MNKHKDKPKELIEIEESFRRAAEDLRRGDPDALAGRMPEEWRVKERARVAAELADAKSKRK